MSLREAWELRNAAATTLVQSEEQLRRQLQSATLEDVVHLLDTFSAARSPGPEWTRSFDALVERLWAWCDPSVLAAAKSDFDARGSVWAPIANALAAEQGERVQSMLRRGTTARFPPFTLV